MRRYLQEKSYAFSNLLELMVSMVLALAIFVLSVHFFIDVVDSTILERGTVV